MATVIVDVMPKPEILDPQGKAVTGALRRLGFSGLAVRQGKRFEIEVDGDLTPERLAKLLSGLPRFGSAARLDEALEPIEVELFQGELDHVADGERDKKVRAGAERLA